MISFFIRIFAQNLDLNYTMFYAIFEILLFIGIILFSIMQKDCFKKLKTFKQESKIGKTEIITDCIIVLFTDLFLGTVFVCILLLILNNYI